jgi:hypothetical protein
MPSMELTTICPRNSNHAQGSIDELIFFALFSKVRSEILKIEKDFDLLISDLDFTISF